MAFFSNRPRSAQQKAQRAQTRILVRLACCAYIIYYVIIPLIKAAPSEETGSAEMSVALRVIIVVVFSVITVLVLILTGREVVRNWKAGLYKASSYEDDDGVYGIYKTVRDTEDEGNSEFGMRNSEYDEDEGNSEYDEDGENSEFGIRNSEYDEDGENSEFGMRNSEYDEDG